MGFIYKISNTINNKVYIGQTIRPIKYRWRDHLNSKENNELHLAIRMLGKQNFYCEQIEQCDDALLNERERYWILYYNSIENGYNMTLGGSTWRGIQEEQLTKQIYELWDQGLSMADIVRQLKITRTIVRDRLYGYANYSEEESKRRGYETVSATKNKTVYQWSTSGELLNIFESAREAEKVTGVSYKNISRAIHKANSAGGFIWSLENIFPKDKESKSKKKVGQYSLDGKLLHVYQSRAEAAKAVNIDSSNIGKCCNGRQKTAGGYIWKDFY